MRQVATTDVLVLSKCDLVTPARAAAFRARLSALAPGARIVAAENGVLLLAVLFGRGTPEKGESLPEAVAWVSAPASALSSMPLPLLASMWSWLPGPAHGLFARPGIPRLGSAALATALAPHARHDAQESGRVSISVSIGT